MATFTLMLFLQMRFSDKTWNHCNLGASRGRYALGRRDHRLGGETEMLEHRACGRRFAERIDTDDGGVRIVHRADIRTPPRGHARLDGDARDAGRQHAGPVVIALTIEDIGAGHRYDAGVDAFVREHRARRRRKRNLGTRGDDDAALLGVWAPIGAPGSAATAGLPLRL